MKYLLLLLLLIPFQAGAEEVTFNDVQVHANKKAIKEAKLQEYIDKCDEMITESESLVKTSESSTAYYMLLKQEMWIKAEAYCTRALLEDK